MLSKVGHKICRHWISRVFFVVLHGLYFEGRGIASYQGGGGGGVYISRLFTCWKGVGEGLTVL